jgi:hypothetical protein
MLQINGQRLLSHIQKLGTIGHDGPRAARVWLFLMPIRKDATWSWRGCASSSFASSSTK